MSSATKLVYNAILLAGGVAEEAVFRRALEQASVDGAASPVESAPGAAAPATPLDVAALPTVGGDLEIRIGDDDTLTVDFLHEGATASRSVAKLLTCTSTAIPRCCRAISLISAWGPDGSWLHRLMITNYHVVNARTGRSRLRVPTTFSGRGRLPRYSSISTGGHFQRLRDPQFFCWPRGQRSVPNV